MRENRLAKHEKVNSQNSAPLFVNEDSNSKTKQTKKILLF